MSKPTCIIDGCASAGKRKGKCDKHYMRDYYIKRRGPEHFKRLEREKAKQGLAAQSLFKACAKCRVDQPRSEFKSNNKTIDGLDSWCRSCHREDARQRYDTDVAAARHERKKDDPHYRAVRKATYDRWRQEHPDRAKAATERWRENNPEKQSLIERNARARRRQRERNQAVGSVDYSAILERDGMHCHICDTDIPSLDVLHFDHVIPLSKGGPHSEDNIKPSHAACNLSKGAKMLAA